MVNANTHDAHDYPVSGMTCEHCGTSVREAVSNLDGVTAVEVDVAHGRLSVWGVVSDEAVRTAIAEAGYEVGS